MVLFFSFFKFSEEKDKFFFTDGFFFVFTAKSIGNKRESTDSRLGHVSRTTPQ